jgi:osmotically-inducible protein OsmY
MFGTTTVGGMAATNPQAARGGTMSTGMGMTGMGTTGLGGMTGMGGLGAGQMGMGGQIVTPLQNTGFVGASSASGNFLSRVGTTGQPGMTGMAGLGGGAGGIGGVGGARVNLGSLQNLMNRSRQNTFNQQQAQRGARGAVGGQNQNQVPIRLTLGFQPQPVSPPRLTATLTQRLTKVPALPSANQIRLEMAGQTVILRGTVASEDERQLAEGLIRLEPGVAAVRNELVVAAAPEALPAPTNVP